MSIRPTVRRATTVSGAVLAMCLAGGGVAFADVLPVPLPAPAPSDPVATVQQTVTSLAGALDPTPSPTPSTLPSVPSLLPALPLPTSGAGAPGTGSVPQVAGSGSQAAPATAPHAPATPKHPVKLRTTTTRAAKSASHPHAPSLSTSRARSALVADTTSAAMPALDTPSLDLPPVHGVGSSTDAAAPAVAPLLMAPTVQHINPLAGITSSDHGGFPLRGLALALAVAAAGGVAFEHLRMASRRLAG